MTRLRIKRVYRFECFSPEGESLWVREIENLVPTEGLNYALTAIIGAGTVYMGLINAAGFTTLAATDTAAQIGGSNGWAEATGYSQSVRQTVTFGTVTAGVVSNVLSPCSFTANANFSLYGGFLVTSSTKNGTSGKILGEAAGLVSPTTVLSGAMLTGVVTLTLVSD